MDQGSSLLGGDERLFLANEVVDLQEPFDDSGPRRRRPEPLVLHGLPQLLVLDELARRLHRAEERRLRVARRWLGLPFFDRDLCDGPLLPDRNRWQNRRLLLLFAASYAIGVEPPPSNLQDHPPAREERLAPHLRDDLRVLETSRREEDRQETPHDEVIDFRLV